MQTSTDLKRLTNEAQALFGELQEGEATIEFGFDHALELAWQFGKKLNQLKERVGHGSWEKWRADSFPKLSKTKSCNCMALDRNNPNVLKSGDLSKESVRKFRFGYVPVKDRPKLKGDKRISRTNHHSSVVNECNKLMQRIESRQYKPPKELDADFEPFLRFMVARRAQACMAPL